jgi:Ca2+-binding RTX toxin-like protein
VKHPLSLSLVVLVMLGTALISPAAASTFGCDLSAGVIAYRPSPEHVVVVEGTAGNDVIDCSASTDGMQILGLAGDDLIYGGSGWQMLIGDDFHEEDGGGNDELFAGSGDGEVGGGPGDDLVNGGAGNQSIGGGSGNDILTAGSGSDRLVGGTGFDTLDYSASPGSVKVDLQRNRTLAGDGNDWLQTVAGDPNYAPFEKVIGSNFDDTLTGTGAADSLWGGNGSDRLTGDAGDDVLDGGAGRDTLSGGKGTDTCTTGERLSGCE